MSAVEQDADALCAAVQSADGDRAAEILLRYNAHQLPELQEKYQQKSRGGLDGIKDWYLRNTLRYLLLGRVGMQVYWLNSFLRDKNLYKQYNGHKLVAGTILGYSNADLETINSLYKAWYDTTIVKEIQKVETEPRRGRFLCNAMTLQRPAEDQPIDEASISRDLDELIRTGYVEQPTGFRETIRFAYRSGRRAGRSEGLALDEEAFCKLLLSRSNAQIREMDRLYQLRTERSLEDLVQWGYENPISMPVKHLIRFANDRVAVICELMGSRARSELRTADFADFIYWLVWIHYEPELLQRVRYCWDANLANSLFGMGFMKTIGRQTSGSLRKLLLNLVKEVENQPPPYKNAST